MGFSKKIKSCLKAVKLITPGFNELFLHFPLAFPLLLNINNKNS